MRLRWWGLIPGIALVIWGAQAQAAVVLPPQCPDCVRWAAGDVTAALAGVQVSDAPDIRVSVQPAVIQGSNAFSLAVSPTQVSITGSDPVGAMYGLLELSEQIRNGGATAHWADLVAHLTSTTQRPALKLRADNPFIHATDTTLAFDVPMWKAYIDMLARNRFNWLDLHSAYNLESTQFPNILPLLVPTPGYSKVGNHAQQVRNLADFGAIVSYAKSRGVGVSLMDYSAEGLAPRRHGADYTAQAVAELLRQIPDLAMIGFRIGESGHSSHYLTDAYLRGIRLSGRRDVHLYTRTWLVPEREIDQIGHKTGGNLDIEIKYNGEQLGSPYQALGKGSGSYSFEGYIKAGAPYHIIWQVRANGTHRFWAWADSDFIRRTVRTCTLGHALGFSLEPYIAYCHYLAAPYYRSPTDQAVYRYIWQKYWMWYLAWGRLAYNPDLPESTLVAAYGRHYGDRGPAIYRAMQAAGAIVPLVCSYRFQGPDQRQWSPETETGCMVSGDPHWWYKDLATRATHIGTGGRDGIDALSFARQAPMDTASFASMQHFVWSHIHHEPDGRIGPPWVARILSHSATATRDAVAQVGNPPGRAGDEWRLLKVDLLCAADLANYYSDRILGTVHLLYATETGSAPDYQQAVGYLERSRQRWAAVAGRADALYAPLNNGMRHEMAYQWSMDIPLLNRIDLTAATLWAHAAHRSDAAPLNITQADLGSSSGFQVEGLHDDVHAGHVGIACRVTSQAGIKGVNLWYRPLPSESDWQHLAMSPAVNGVFWASVPIHREGMIYFLEVVDGTGLHRNYPNPLIETPYKVIDPWAALGAL